MKEETKAITPPNDLVAEESLLGGVLVDSEAFNKVADLLVPEDFYRTGHGEIFSLMIELYEKNQPIDIVTVSSLAKTKGVLEKLGGVVYLSRLEDLMPSSANIREYGALIKDKSLIRKVMDSATTIIEKGRSALDAASFIDEAESLIFKVSESKTKPSFTKMSDIAINSLKMMERMSQSRKTVVGLETGFHDLDKLTSGLQNQDLIIVAGRPSMGKTALAMNIAENVATRENPTAVAVFSLEMSKEQLAMRLIASDAEVDNTRLKNGSLNHAEWRRVAESTARIYDAPIYIDDSAALNALELRARARRLKREADIGLVIVDYLQLMRGRAGASREQEISEISRSLKTLAKEINVPVMALSQLNRLVEQRDNKRPQLSDLRESGAIEQDADLILFVYRDEVYNRNPDREDTKALAEIIIGKQRNGPIDTIELLFMNKFASFRNIFLG